MDIIIRNSARCLSCGDEIVSRSRHDYVTCTCGNLSVDGGAVYLRRVFRDGSLVEDTSEVAEVEEEGRSHQLEHSGIWLSNVHHSAECAGRPCTVHRRSDHPLRSWPQEWHDGRMVRVCGHGVRHRDPDDPFADGCPPRCDGCCGVPDGSADPAGRPAAAVSRIADALDPSAEQGRRRGAVARAGALIRAWLGDGRPFERPVQVPRDWTSDDLLWVALGDVYRAKMTRTDDMRDANLWHADGCLAEWWRRNAPEQEQEQEQWPIL